MHPNKSQHLPGIESLPWKHFISLQFSFTYWASALVGWGWGVGDGVHTPGLGDSCKMYETKRVLAKSPSSKKRQMDMLTVGGPATTNFMGSKPLAWGQMEQGEDTVHWLPPLRVSWGLWSMVPSPSPKVFLSENTLWEGALHLALLLASMSYWRKKFMYKLKPYQEGLVMTAWGFAESCQELTLKDSYLSFSVMQYCVPQTERQWNLPDALEQG